MRSLAFCLPLALAIARPNDEATVSKQTIWHPSQGDANLPLVQFNNSDPKEKPKSLELAWSYSADEVKALFRTMKDKYGSKTVLNSIRFMLTTKNHDGWLLFGLSRTPTFGGNDMVLLKHSCHGDDKYNEMVEMNMGTEKFNDTVLDIMDHACSNFTFLPVNVNGLGSLVGDLKPSKQRPVTFEDKATDKMTITPSTVKNIPLSTHMEDIWYENPPVFRIDPRSQQQMMLRMLPGISGPAKRPDVIRKTQLMRKINPENCDYVRLDSPTVYVQWAFLSEELEINSTHFDRALADIDFTLEVTKSAVLNYGVKPIHFIDHFDFDNTTTNYDPFNSTTKAKNATVTQSDKIRSPYQWDVVNEVGEKENSVASTGCSVLDLGEKFTSGSLLVNRIQLVEETAGHNSKPAFTSHYDVVKFYTCRNGIDGKQIPDYGESAQCVDHVMTECTKLVYIWHPGSIMMNLPPNTGIQLPTQYMRVEFVTKMEMEDEKQGPYNNLKYKFFAYVQKDGPNEGAIQSVGLMQLGLAPQFYIPPKARGENTTGNGYLTLQGTCRGKCFVDKDLSKSINVVSLMTRTSPDVVNVRIFEVDDTEAGIEVSDTCGATEPCRSDPVILHESNPHTDYQAFKMIRSRQITHDQGISVQCEFTQEPDQWKKYGDVGHTKKMRSYCDAYMYYWPETTDKQYCYSAPKLTAYTNLLKDNGTTYQKSFNPDTLGTDRDWTLGENNQPAIDFLNSVLVTTVDSLDSIETVLQDEFCSETPFKNQEQSKDTSSQLRGIPVDQALNFIERDICPAGVQRRSDMFEKVTSDEDAKMLGVILSAICLLLHHA